MTAANVSTKLKTSFNHTEGLTIPTILSCPNRFDLLNILIPIEGGEEGELIRKIRRVHPTFYILDSKLIDEFVRW